MNQQCIQKLVDFVKNNEVYQVCLHGHGEMTVLPDWHVIANQFYGAGAKLTTCTNLTKTFSQSEIRTLAKFASITVSLDAIDTELFRSLRRGGDIRHILYNMAVIQTAANQNEHNIYWIWDVVVCNKNIHELMNICKMAVTYGVKTITLCNLVKLTPQIPEAKELKHPLELPPQEIALTMRVISQCYDYCREHDITLIHDSLTEALKQDA
jgi:MoaA/NifB/PqqE/SkfB family radical SAM enzyme